MTTRTDLERIARIARTLIKAALLNRDVQAHLINPTLAGIWTAEAVRRSPPVRVEWEYVTVIGSVGESLAAAKNKRWGQFVGITPLRADDPVHPSRILYIYSPECPYNRRVEQRNALKRILGRHHRKLVTRALRNTKRDFLARLDKTGAFFIKRCFNLDPGRFWRVAKGREFINLPTPPVQLLLFSDEPDDTLSPSCTSSENPSC
jgi:hypothetical protein